MEFTIKGYQGKKLKTSGTCSAPSMVEAMANAKSFLYVEEASPEPNGKSVLTRVIVEQKE